MYDDVIAMLENLLLKLKRLHDAYPCRALMWEHNFCRREIQEWQFLREAASE